MKKILIIFVSIFGLSWLSYANCGNDNGNGNGCSGNIGTQGPVGPVGPQGPQGNPGLNGSNGTNGTNGVNGTNGATGPQGAKGNTGATGPQGPSRVDPRMNEARLGIDTAIRLYDGKRVQLQAYNIWSPALHPGEDTLGDGRNLQFGVRFVYKLGSSYEERQNNALKAKLEALEAMFARLQ